MFQVQEPQETLLLPISDRSQLCDLSLFVQMKRLTLGNSVRFSQIHGDIGFAPWMGTKTMEACGGREGSTEGL